MSKEKNGTVVAKVPLQDTRLYFKRYDNYENLNNLLITEIEEARDKDPEGMQATNAGCWRSNFKYKCEKELFMPITELLSVYTGDFFPKTKLDAQVVYWTNVNEPGSANIFHSHYRADADISGVYYVQGSKTGVIRFSTHEQMNKMIAPHMPHASMIGHDPSDGDTLLFPSYLLHDVMLNTSNRQRISIAFNAKIILKVEDNVIPMSDGTKKDPGKEKVELNQENIT